MAKSEEGRAKGDGMRWQRERLWKFISARTWPLCQQDCVSGEIPASVSLWGWEPEADGDGIATMAKFLLHAGKSIWFPLCECQTGLEGEGWDKEYEENTLYAEIIVLIIAILSQS